MSPSEADLTFLKAKVERVLLLLDVSVAPPEVKTAWVTLLPHMTLAHVDRLIALLEDEFSQTLKQAQKQPENEEMLLKLKAAKQRYDEKIVAADKAAFTALARIQKELPA